mgnify:CR=1 FL=1
MEEVHTLLEQITRGFPSSHIVRDYLESGEEKKLEAAQLYLLQKESNYGLGPEDEANLAYLLEEVEEPREQLQKIGYKYLSEQEP